MKTKLLVFSLFALLFGFSQQLQAVPAIRTPVPVLQPDGSVLEVYLRGDEHYKYNSTEDNIVIVKNAEDVWVYGEPNEQGTFKPSKVMAHGKKGRKAEEAAYISTLSQEKQLKYGGSLQFKGRTQMAKSAQKSAPQKAFPNNGSPRSIVILVNFTNRSFIASDPNQEFTNMLNQVGYSKNGATGSARDYFVASSGGAFTPLFDVYGPYNLPQTYEYYGENDASGSDLRPQQMIVDACTAAFNAGVNFSQYDADNDGDVDNVFVYYAGYNEAEHAPSSTIWPHKWYVPYGATVFNGKKVWQYACTSELRGSSGSNMCGIGTFTHEFSHVLGLPDCYCTAGTECSVNTLNTWSIMDYGPYLNNGRTPPLYSSYDRFFAGWLVPDVLSAPATITLNPLSSENKAYILAQTTPNLNGKNPNPSEFFMFENRQQTGWDAYLPGKGLLIWHITYDADEWFKNTVNNQSPLGVNLVRADDNDSELSLSGDPFPYMSTNSYSPKLNNNTSLNAPLTSITRNGNQINFAFKGGAEQLLTSKNTINYTANGGDTAVSITASASWTAAKKQSWLSISPNSGSGNGSMTISAGVNNGAERFDTVIVTMNSLTKKIYITQAAKPYVNAGSSSFTFNNFTAQTLDIQSNVEWIITGIPEWINVSNITGTGNASVSVGPNQMNAGPGDRTATLTLKEKSGSLITTITIIQKVTTIPVRVEGLNEKVIVYPNPVSNFLAVKQSDDVFITQIDVLDINDVVRIPSPSVLKQHEISLDLQNLVIGVYTVRIQTDQGEIRYKIIKR